jgi:transcriptional regulator with GAF, ATPase, and Fis domain
VDDQIIGDSQPMLAVFEQVRLVARTDLSVLILGESGTGKELVAHALHRASRRAAMPFVTVDSGALPEALIETELFGYEKGAFTGAEERHPGRFESANAGTLFLDEVCNLPLLTQAKLLRALDRKEIHHLGSLRPLKADVRIIAATNKDPEAAVVEGAFRLDLLYRLNEFPIWLPPLRDREGDIVMLARHFLDAARRQCRKNIRGFSEEVVAALLSHPWPGNVRELKNAVIRAAILAEDVIRVEHLPLSPHGRSLVPQTLGAPGALQSLLGFSPSRAAPVRETQQALYGKGTASNEGGSGGDTGNSLTPPLPLDLKTVTEQAAGVAQRTAILIALEHCRGNKSGAARLLHVDYKTLLSKIKKLEI